jgi:hypothetical protein
MKLLRYGARGSEKPGLLDETGVIRDLSAALGDPQNLSMFLNLNGRRMQLAWARNLRRFF